MTRHTFGAGAVYFFVQATTAAILVLAANTSFSDFPRLSSLIAADRFLPRQLANRGDRLVFSNGIVILAVLAAALIVIFKGSEQSMLPLYALGVFISFTLSQSGMVNHWSRERKADEVETRIREQEREAIIHQTVDPSRASHEQERLAALEKHKGGHWLSSLLINGIGALVTFIVGLVIAITKFTHGAWGVIIVIGLIVLMFRAINRHYGNVTEQLALHRSRPLGPLKHQVIVPISGVHKGTISALRYAKSLCGDGLTPVSAVYVEVNPLHTEELKIEWEKWGMGIPLKIIESPYRSISTPLVEYINREAEKHDDTITTVVLPEYIPRGWWQHLLHNQTTLLIKGKLLFDPNIVVVSVPYHLWK